MDAHQNARLTPFVDAIWQMGTHGHGADKFQIALATPGPPLYRARVPGGNVTAGFGPAVWVRRGPAMRARPPLNSNA